MSKNLAINGGKPVRLKKWPTYIDGFGSMLSESSELVNKVLSSGRLFRYDTRPLKETMVGKLEETIKNYFNCEYALAVSSGTAALAIALMSLDLPNGYGVACPTFGFQANPSAILLAGGIPHLFACNESLNYDIEDLRNRWDDNIKVIMVVHMRGMAQPIEEILNFAKEKGVFVIEDAVPSLGVSVKSKPLGTFSDFGCFSMQSDKTINTGEGGFIITNSKNLFERAVVLSGAFESRVNGHFEEANIQNNFDQQLPLYSFRMDELRAAVALSQFPTLNDKLAKYKSNYNYLIEKIQQYVKVREPYYADGFLGDSLIFFVDDERGSEVARCLSAEGINARCLGEADNVRSFTQWKFLKEVADVEFLNTSTIKRTTSLLNSTVDVPLSHMLEKEDLDDLVQAIEKVIKELF